MSRPFKDAQELIRQRAIEYPENPEIAERLWTLLLKNPDNARHLWDFIIREADRIGRMEEREAIMDVLRHIPQSSLRYSPSSSSSSEEAGRSAAGP